jgi:ParB-like chromosome segregation protein Spo0J
MYTPEEVIIIGIDTPDEPSHWGYDGESNKAPLLEASVRFTMEIGIMQAVLGRRDGDKIVIVAGRRRTRLLREANARRVAEGAIPWRLPTKIVMGNELRMRILKTAENSHRLDRNPMARAREAYDLSQQMPEAEAATMMGLGVPQFKSIIKLLDLAPPVAAGVAAGVVKPTAALELAALSAADQTARMAEIMASSNGKKVTQRAVKAKINAASGQESPETPSTRVKKIGMLLDKLDDRSSKDDLWELIKKIRCLLKKD